MRSPYTAVVVIGRNEGERLKRCLRSIPAGVPVVYVDSGSTDGSVEFAESIGVDVLALDLSIGFTAARARNSGWRYTCGRHPSIEYIQFVDGDCELDPAWLETACAAIQAEPEMAAVFGRLRERFPERSIFNRMCDDEWNVPVGIVASCGGNALIRATALKAVEGYSDDLIAGEEPDLCVRLARLGKYIRRIDAEMAFHDANIYRFGSWWQRARRSGFAYAEHVLRHREQSITQWRRQLRSLIFWGFAWPFGMTALALTAAMWRPALGFGFLVVLGTSYALQVGRIAAHKHGSGSDWGFSLRYGALIVIGKFAEFTGAVQCWLGRGFRRKARIIEYKGQA